MKVLQCLLRCARSGFQGVSQLKIILLHQLVVQLKQHAFKICDVCFDHTIHRCQNLRRDSQHWRLKNQPAAAAANVQREHTAIWRDAPCCAPLRLLRREQSPCHPCRSLKFRKMDSGTGRVPRQFFLGGPEKITCERPSFALKRVWRADPAWSTVLPGCRQLCADLRYLPSCPTMHGANLARVPGA